jgi:hypothetical protein
MNKVVLYIKDVDNVYQAVDLFEDETISVTSKIQDIRDISKVFTDFSQSFTIPASKKNNKIFKHFYNYFISEGAFDARKKVDAQLEVNYIPFRDGKILLNSVKMKDNKPFAYNVTFFGNTVTLKDLLGDDELESLTWLDNFAYTYNNTQTKSRFQSAVNVTVGSETFETPIIVPLITHTKRLFFNSNNNTAATLSGNIAYQGGSGTHHRGVGYQDLKPAISLRMVIKAIERKYGIEFTDDFFTDFGGTDNPKSAAFAGIAGTQNDGLYMWLSREKGAIGASNVREFVLKNFTHSSGDTLADFDTLNITPSIEDSGTDEDSVFNIEEWIVGSGTALIDYRVQFDLTITTSSPYSYDLKVVNTLDNNAVIAEYTAQEGTNTFSFGRNFSTYGGTISGIKMIVSANTAFLATTSLRVRQIEDRAKGTDTTIADGYYTSSNIATVETIRPTERMPKMKIYDFLTGIFKMFNLTAYYIDDRSDILDYGKIKVLPLDDYYDDNPRIFDITKYVDSTETDIDATIPYSEIEFKHKDPKTLLMLQHKEANNEIFGDSEYKNPDIDRGKPYKVETPFEHLKFERLLDDADLTGTTITDIMWGYSAGDNFKPDAGDYDPVLTAPLLFYGIRVTGLSTTPDQRISWLDNGTHSPLSTYWMPSNGVNRGTSQTNPLTTGTTTATVAGSLYDSSADFDNVNEGDVVVNTTDDTTTVVVSVESTAELLLEDDIFVSGEDYMIYGDSAYTINFDSEKNEWTFEDYGIYANSLFKRFYKTYIEDVFNPKKRIFKLTAHLPSSILLNYKLNDRFQIGDKVFTINSIDTNLKTGESKLELLNVL